MQNEYKLKNNIVGFYSRTVFSQWYGIYPNEQGSFMIDNAQWKSVFDKAAHLPKDTYDANYMHKLFLLKFDSLIDMPYINTFNCCEQAMMFGKAIIFGDFETAKAILNTKNAKEQKALGRSVKNFNEEVWDLVKFKLVCKINLHKFSQNEDLKAELLKTHPYILVEVSPYDKIWGNGVALDKEDEWGDVSKWKGQNLLGEALEVVRTILRNGQ